MMLPASSPDGRIVEMIGAARITHGLWLQAHPS